MPRRLSIAGGMLLTAAIGCGDTVIVLPPGSGGGSASSAGGSDSELCTPDGIRLCGGTEDCPELEFAACPGVGCTAAADHQTGMPLDAGVCWPDIPNWADEPCIACDASDACVHRAPDELFCVPRSVCDALGDLGATTACTYTDKTAYTGEPTPELPGCPAIDDVCGGDCGACAPQEVCTGLSPTHPFGMCVGKGTYRGTQCTFDAEFYPLPVPCPDSELCAVWQDGDPADQATANRFGVCLIDHNCIERANALGGAIRCFDATGHAKAP